MIGVWERWRCLRRGCWDPFTSTNLDGSTPPVAGCMGSPRNTGVPCKYILSVRLPVVCDAGRSLYCEACHNDHRLVTYGVVSAFGYPHTCRPHIHR